MTDPYLGQRTLMRAFLDAVWPPGSIWRPGPGGDLDHLLDGISDGWQAVHDDIASLAYLRDPRRTPYLEMLEREYGVSPNTQLTEAVRRTYLARRKYGRGASTSSNLQAELDAMGFGTGGYGLQVFANDPPVNPTFFTTQVCQSFCGGPNAYCGYTQNGLPTHYWSAIAWNGTVWCAVSLDGYCATSPDLIVWTAQTITARAWSAMVWTGTVFCIVSTDGYCSTSPTGVTWTPQTMIAGNWRGLCWTGAQLVAVGLGPTNYCATSPTGMTWTAQAGMPAGNWNGIAWNGAMLCAVGDGSLATSSTGVTWTVRVISGAPPIFYLCTIAWNGSAWCAVGAIWASAISYGAVTSPDGITWTPSAGPGYSTNYRSMIWVASLNLFVCVGEGDKLCNTSPDGITWTLRAIPAGTWKCVAFNGTTLAAVGWATIQEATSTNAITWTVGGTGSAGAAFCGFIGGAGTFIINGDSYVATPGYYGCGMAVMCCGYTTSAGAATACAGYYATLIYAPAVVASPPDPWSWYLIFFLASAITRDASGYIVGTTSTRLPSNLRQQLVETVLRIKPIHSWGVLMADWS